MGEIAKYLRFLIPADQEAKVTVVNVTSVPTKFTSQLTTENARRRIGVHNLYPENSGECFYSFSAIASPSGESMIIPSDGHPEYIPIGDTENIDLYFFCEEGNTSAIQVIELA